MMFNANTVTMTPVAKVALVLLIPLYCFAVLVLLEGSHTTNGAELQQPCDVGRPCVLNINIEHIGVSPQLK